MLFFLSFALAGAPLESFSNVEKRVVAATQGSAIHARNFHERILFPKPHFFRLIVSQSQPITQEREKMLQAYGEVELVLGARAQMVVHKSSTRLPGRIPRHPALAHLRATSRGLAAPHSVPTVSFGRAPGRLKRYSS